MILCVILDKSINFVSLSELLCFWFVRFGIQFFVSEVHTKMGAVRHVIRKRILARIYLFVKGSMVVFHRGLRPLSSPGEGGAPEETQVGKEVGTTKPPLG